jgi:hypothetical protein
MRKRQRILRFTIYSSADCEDFFTLGDNRPMRRITLLLVLVGALAVAGPLPKELRGAWKVESMRCGGAEVPKKVAQSYKAPNSITFGFEAAGLKSEWKAGKCRYEVSYDAESSERGKFSGSLTGRSRCVPDKCMGSICTLPLPKGITFSYGYRLEKRKLEVTSQMGIECLAQGLSSPAEFRLKKIR